ncbi:MAG: hypothetical protein ACI8S6_004433 [Myxococcota bacterium]|jgi:hypothetical protein
MRWLRLTAVALAPLIMPALVLFWAGDLVIGQHSLDLIGHVWTMWAASEGSLTRTELAAYPAGADLLPILGGWLDILTASLLTRGLGLSELVAYNLVAALWLAVTGWGGFALARALGASWWSALLAGLMLQLDGYALHHLIGGRTEQAGLGFIALALAGAVVSWRRSGWRWSVACGLAGASVIYLSWEHAIWLALAMTWLAPFFVWSGRPAGALSRWALSASVTVAVAGPWAALFLHRASSVRELDEGQQTLQWAMDASAAPIGWLLQPVRPTTLALLALLVIPWTAPRIDRRLWLGAGVGLVLTFLLAMGPSPGLWAPGDIAEGVWGPFFWMQSTPVLGWFHTPDRLLAGWSLAAAVAAALLVDRVTRLRVWLGPVLGAVLLASSLGHVFQGRLWPAGGWRPGGPPVLSVLAAVEGEGAVFDLPPVRAGMDAMQYTIYQMIHRRPIAYHMTLPFLTTDVYGQLSEDNATLRWISNPQRRPAPETLSDDLRALRASGFRWVVLHPTRLPPPTRASTLSAFSEALGPPILQEPGRWICWELP